MEQHGTIERYRKHLANGDRYENIDQACKDARNKYERESSYYSSPQRRAQMRRTQAIRRRALTRLGAEYPERFAQLAREEEINEMVREMQDGVDEQ